MLIIANNITTRDNEVDRLFRQAEAGGWGPEQAETLLADLAQQGAAAGADALEIDLQQHHDSPEAMEYAVRAVQQVTALPLCLSTNSAKTLEAGMKVCSRPPIANYVSVEETRLKEMLPLIARRKAEVVFLVSDPANPTDAKEMLQKAAILIGAANASGIPNERIILDPGLIHITSEPGQRHLVEVLEFLRNLPDATDPPVRSACWLGNVSSGAAGKLRPLIEATLLPMLAGLGLSAVFLDILRREHRRTARLLKMFRNERVYSDADIEL